MSQPPVAPQHPHVHREHGVERPDPYAWLKDKHGEESLAYLRAERAHFDSEMEPLRPFVEQLRAEMFDRIPPQEESARWREGKYEYFTRDPEGGEYSQLWRVDDAGDEHLLLDQNQLVSAGEFLELGIMLVSPDARYLAYSTDVAGDEVYELHFRDTTTGEDLADTIPHTYYGGAWSADSGTFFYVVHDERYRPYQVWRHRIGTDRAADVLVYQDLDEKFDVMLWEDRADHYVMISSASGTTSEVWLVDSEKPETPARVVTPRREGVLYSVAHRPGGGGGDLLLLTNDGAEDFRLMRTPLETSSADSWVELLPETPGVRLHDIDVFVRHVVVSAVTEAHQVLHVFAIDALAESSVTLADAVRVEPGVAGGLMVLWHNEEPDADHVMVEVESFIQPIQWLQIDLNSGSRTLVKSQVVQNYDPEQYLQELIWVDARDGVRVPVKVARRRETPLDGSAPMLLYGYGAYESSFWPGFDSCLVSLLDRGVVVAQALVRGGGEMGRRWYLDGSMMNKLNTFTDFIDVADGMAARGLVDGDRIVSNGLSAGGLLQGVAYSIRPDRWRAVVAEVPFVDVVNSMFDHNVPLTAKEVDEWGDPRIKQQFDYLLSYSPYENVPSEGRPELLVTGALHDPRVLVHEPAKWVARIRETAQPGDPRTLFRVELEEGGHIGPIGRYAHLA
ncbi:MAG: prolyl oligopeptidase family serine peptidase, partial [Actinomycetia bacterium]|nr:prolyl oligopeptidase family serine peptidase [Actinomycetes bacterium]